MKYFGALGVTVIVVSAIFFAISVYNKIVRQDKEEAARHVWFDAHKCKREGYIARGTGDPWRLYRCDDGMLYTWWDIPTKAP